MLQKISGNNVTRLFVALPLILTAFALINLITLATADDHGIELRFNLKSQLIVYNPKFWNSLSDSIQLKNSTVFKKDSVYSNVDQMPKYSGGEKVMLDFLSTNIKYPEIAKTKKIQGTVYATFIVEPNGLLTNVKIMRGIGYGCDEETIRVINLMPKWKAGKLKGKPVRVNLILPIKFQL